MLKKWNFNLLVWVSLMATDAKAQTSPKVYQAPFLAGEIVVDGIPDSAWDAAEWSDLFIDIQGEDHKKPTWDTKVKMIWDNDALYILAWLEEPHIWAYLENRDDIVFRDNDFEVFVKPDASTEHYFEYEMNARNTLMDLLMTKPYNKGGKAIMTWNSPSITHAVGLEGTLNDPDDEDQGWWVEIRLPYQDIAHHGSNIAPAEGKSWKINFSRVQWQTTVVDGKYVKMKDENGRNIPEDNWVWTPQYVINMHVPEHWGTVQFVKHRMN